MKDRFLDPRFVLNFHNKTLDSQAAMNIDLQFNASIIIRMLNQNPLYNGQ